MSDLSSDLKKAASMLKGADKIVILTHKSPDGDTLGSAFALCRALLKLGKKVRVECSDAFPKKYEYLYEGIEFPDFEPELIVASDIATENLFGDKLDKYKGKVGLCIDHHPSNEKYATFTAVNPKAAANCESIPKIINLLDVEIDNKIANCIYTGLATDTGCFRFSNTTAKTLNAAARMIELGADSARINKKLFETMSKSRIEMERMVFETLEYHFDGRAALIVITRDMYEKTGISESETEGIPSIPARIEGVMAGITIKEKGDSIYKISLRTSGGLNASQICSKFGGGGHACAAGCEFNDSIENVKTAVLSAVEEALKNERYYLH